ncbi:PREDICTED: zinc finger CCCH domain-containing protein 13-like [Rhagoletis zephyria]|uniref:zinc finger CCCH domain-containing protein 13-like n=1 Tax=Rhagoletis zephyria TaxID=28612 RepID=UPI0008115C10|nr:PREDICTED: zinc finger CCCH domain-containing protein 13-like [Rhagoletis zephyria]XP_017476449.1 PREDICTED: zinc finger CCCH domain-containing protein 13-like [Rhagoletis zephyria]
MDFKNLCQNIDVSSLRARIPSLPAMPAMPQIKLPKSLPKLRPRRIFSRSREDLSRDSKGSKKEQQLQQQQQHSPFQQLSVRPPIPPADFVNHSPQRISTISSLMHQQKRGDSQRGTYRSACSVDDDYPRPREFEVPERLSRPISPIHTSISGVTNERDAEGGAVAKMSLSEKLQKGYKDITEFRLSHIFAKKTVVRRDVIQVDHYVERFNEDRERERAEQEQRDRKIADNYRFNFKVSRQDTDNSKRSMSSDDSPKQEPQKGGKTVHVQSEDESGMEATPPPRKPGIASTRFARVRNPPLEQYISDDSNNELDEDEELPVDRGGHQKQRIVQSSPESGPKAPAESRGAKALYKLRSLGKRSEETPEKLGEKKRRAPLSPQQSEEKPELPIAAENDNPLSVLKQNIKRFSKSIRRTQEADSSGAANPAEDTEGEGTPKKETKQISRTEKLAARLRKFASHEASTENLDETASPKQSEEQRSPIRAAISNKLQTWKKSFKRKPNETDGAQTGEETSPEREGDKEKRTDKLMKKLRNMRQRKRASSTDDLDGTEDGANQTPTGKSKDDNCRRAVNFEERFEQARKRTLKKVNEKMQQIKFFHKSQENIEKESGGGSKKDAGKPAEQEYEDQSDDERTIYVRPHTAARRAAARDTPSDSEEEQQPESEERVEQIRHVEREFDGTHIQHTRAIWTTKNLLTDSLDSETDTELPRVLIHQDNSDQFESTLIIAVTRPAPPVTPTTPIIEEIHDEPPMKPLRASRTPSPGSSRAEWIPNNEIISSFLEITPPSKRRLSSEAILPAPRGHLRKMSLDSNSDSDSWIPELARAKKLGQQSRDGSEEGASAATLNSIDEKEEPWKVHHTHCDDKLYKTRSIDIFEASVRKGGAIAAFDDFEEELRDEPILKVPQRHIDSSFEKDSSEEPFAADDDNSSRVTKILRSVIREECEEVQENVDEKLEMKLPQVPQRKFSNSSESLIANIDENESERIKLHEKDNDESNAYEDDEDDDDRPPSAAPSPPPSMSPPPPPLPLRKSVLITSKTTEEGSPPLPTTKPPVQPIPPAKPSQPPRIPDRTPSMTRIAKPLVKTSSLRLAYNEQVNPSDVGKVNKLISRFETPQSKLTQRPRIIRRGLTRDESEEYSDDDDLEEDEDEDGEQDTDEANANAERDVTPTPTNTPRTYSLESETESLHVISKHATTTKPRTLSLEETTTTTNRSIVGNSNQTKVYSEVPRITLNYDNNSNLSLSRASSEYGSPLEYPSSLIGSTETTPIPERRPPDLSTLRNAERNRRSMTRDDDKFLSFDSDDENSYYSISSTGSSRYVVEI